MDFSQIKKELTMYCHMLYERGYVQGSGGNVSCRIAGTDLFAIKKTAVNMRVMTEQDVIIVDGDGNVVEGNGKPSKEVNFHLGVMHLRPEINAVVHAHPNFSIAFANNEIPLPHTTVTSKKIVGYVPFVEAAPSGTKELADYVINGFKENPESIAVLMKEHGVCVGGTSLAHAYNVTDILEQTAMQAYYQCQISKDVEYYKNLKHK